MQLLPSGSTKSVENTMNSSLLSVPIVTETLGSWGKSTSKVLKGLGKRLVRKTKDPRAATFLSESVLQFRGVMTVVS